MVQRNTHSRLIALALILHSIIISFVAAWLARDTALASSAHSLQEMTDADEGRKTPFSAIKDDSA